MACFCFPQDFIAVAAKVLVEKKSCARVIILNRTKQLNELSFYMVSRLLEIFLEDEGNPDIKLVTMKGNGRAFCAGGDVSAVVRDVKGWRLGAKFFENEFKLNYLMATYSKPQVSILNGIVMGGGAGASIHGRFHVATEKTAELENFRKQIVAKIMLSKENAWKSETIARAKEMRYTKPSAVLKTPYIQMSLADLPSK